MVSLASNVRAAIFSAAIGVSLVQSAQAADMPFFTPSVALLNEGPVEFGTGWYLRGDIAAAKAPVLNIDGANLSPDFPNNWSAGLGAGYQYNSWFRTDVTVDYEQIFSRSSPEFAIFPCQIGAAPELDPTTGLIIGSTPILAEGGCSPFFQSRATTMAVLANAYLDLGNWWGFTPYIGAGVGVDVLFQKAQVQWFQQNLVPYAGVTWIDPFSLATVVANLDRSSTNSFLRFAYAFMGGVSYDVTDHWKVDVGYRWLNLGKIEGADIFGNRVKRQLDIQQLRVGFRYVID